jgi:hypothetical protein
MFLLVTLKMVVTKLKRVCSNNNKQRREKVCLVVLSYTLLHKVEDICLCCSVKRKGCEEWWLCVVKFIGSGTLWYFKVDYSNKYECTYRRQLGTTQIMMAAILYFASSSQATCLLLYWVYVVESKTGYWLSWMRYLVFLLVFISICQSNACVL